MEPLEFEWDEAKNSANQRKHGVSFEQATSVFYDARGLFMADPGHSSREDRFILLGLSSDLETLVVCHCYRGGDVIRVTLSANMSETVDLTEFSVEGERG